MLPDKECFQERRGRRVATSAGGVPHPLLSPLASPELSASDDSSLSDGLPREEGERGFRTLVSWAPV